MNNLQEYENLRKIHSVIKLMTRESICGIHHFTREPKKLPKKYGNILWAIDKLLHDAEKIVCKF